MKLKISICIPTYNRCAYLKECLDSILLSIAGYESQIEIIVSDNASTDDTENVISEIVKTHPWIWYYRNDVNIGAERNFYYLATLAIGDYIWILGDDDKIEKEAIANVINQIESGYNLIISNYSMWSKDFTILIKQSGLNMREDQVFNDPNELMQCFGLHLSYISSVIIKKDIFFKTSSVEFESYAEYGFSYLYAVYAGIASNCHAICIATPIVLNRSGNSGGFDWWKYFVMGTALIFEALSAKGYSKNAIFSAKHQVLRDTIIPHVLSMGVRGDNDRGGRIGLMLTYYKNDCLFWFVGLPVLLVPTTIARLGKKIVLTIRSVITGQKLGQIHRIK